jgi:membrane-bound lytic murein transglycosylase F
MIKKIVVSLHPLKKGLLKKLSLAKKSILLFVVLLSVIIYCWNQKHSYKNQNKAVVACDLDSIRKRGKLIAVTDFNSTDYFLYKGEPMGFNYELLKSFSDNIGIDLEIISENHPEKAFGMLKSGNADLLAFNLMGNTFMQNDVLFTSPIGKTRQVLVQHKPANWRSMSNEELEKKLVRTQRGLGHKTIFVQSGSSHAEQLISLAKEIGDSINIIEVPFESEKLIQNVSEGEIEYAVCDENIAMVNASYYRDIDVSTPVSEEREFTWGVRKNHSDKIISELNRWIKSYKNTESYALLYAKYFKNTRSSIIVRSDFYALNTGKVSKYDDMIRQFSVSIKWDWRLLASLICQESRFNPTVESYTGAFGLMQVMPVTGRNFGIDITSSPENNIKAGISYINWLHTIFDPKIPDEKERINFILAAYNAGPGHILDAMKLAEKNGMNPQIWEGNVAVWLLKKSEARYFRDSVVKSGYFRGKESVAFVSEILNRYEHYKNILPSQKSK